MEAIRKKTTAQLMNEIQEKEDIRDFHEENSGEFQDMSLSAYLQTLLKEKGIKRAEIFRKAGLVGSNYGYEIFQNDKKAPSRDILLMICIAFPLTIEETQQVLRRAGLAILYPRDLRDAYVLYGIKNRFCLEDLNALLIEKGLQPLS